jgi:hypothetical protein
VALQTGFRASNRPVLPPPWRRFGCAHRWSEPSLVRPATLSAPPISGWFCLDCGKQFSYDLKEMRVGKPIDRSRDGGVVPPGMPKPRKSKLRYAMLAVLPLAFLAGVVTKPKKKPEEGADSGKAGHPQIP